jgi:hypothetical protein
MLDRTTRACYGKDHSCIVEVELSRLNVRGSSPCWKVARHCRHALSVGAENSVGPDMSS